MRRIDRATWKCSVCDRPTLRSSQVCLKCATRESLSTADIDCTRCTATTLNPSGICQSCIWELAMAPAAERRTKLIKAQMSRAVFFIDRTGNCPACKKDIVAALGDKMLTELITGCPHCNRSFCD